jgi:hypothetical protein
MKHPFFKDLDDPDENPVQRSYAQLMHPNPSFYKYRWWVFWENSLVEGNAFLEDRYALSTAVAMALIDELERDNKPYIIYNRQIPRFEPGVTPFDVTKSKWQNTKFAPALSSDPDPQWEGHR